MILTICILIIGIDITGMIDNYNSNFGHYQGAQNSGSKIQYNNISPPSTPTSSGTSGFSGNPVATNPVTSGGAKKKN